MRRLSQVLFLFVVILRCKADEKEICDILDHISQSAISEGCRKQMSSACNNPELLWKLFDASSKYPITGGSYGNGFDYGNFDECLSIDYEYEDGRILGKHCSLGLVVPTLSLGQFPVAASSQNLYKAINKTIKNLGTYDVQLPREDQQFTTALSKLSICVPDACTPEETGKYFLYGYLSDVIFYTGIPCATKETYTDFDPGDICFLVFFAIVLLVMVTSTVYDSVVQTKGIEVHHPILVTFSILTNGKKLLYVSTNQTEQIQVFNGMRVISTIWIIAFHGSGSYQGGYSGVTNWGDVEEWTNSWYNRYIRSALVAVDTFFFMSGCLLAYGYLKTATREDSRTQIRKVPSLVLHRYLRLTPAVAVMFLALITVFRQLGSGPLWVPLVETISGACKDHWWQFFLYIQNYSNYENMCLVPTWYLSADMQMFVLAPLVLIPTAIFIEKRFKTVMGSLMVLTIVSTIVSIVIPCVTKDTSNVNTTHDRFNDFLIGIMFGSFLRMKRDQPFIFSKFMNLVLWIVLSLVSLAFLIYWHDVEIHYEVNKYSLFMGLYKPIWCTFLAFVVYSCYHGHGGIFNWFLTRPIFQILGRLTYSMYVLHYVVELYWGGIARNNLYFSDYLMFYDFCGHLIVTMILATFWVLAFEMPMITIEKLIKTGFKNNSNTVKPKV